MKSTVAHLPSSPAPPTVDDRAGKYLCFRLGKEDFAIHAARVREIMPMQALAVVPRSPAHVKGVMNLRGKLIPVIDLKLKLGAPGAEATPRSSIVVVHIENTAGSIPIGMIVDSISEVLTLKSGEIDNSAADPSGPVAHCLIGVAKVKGKAKYLLSLNLLLSAGELQSLPA